jgi:tyrosyl-tRNA synthetase
MASDLRTRLLAGTAEVIPEGGLEEKLALGRPLRVKLGLDPTAADVTLGWAVVLRKLRRFQDAGHTAVLIVGDFTARVGDPSGRSDTRPRLSKEEVRDYAQRVLDQFWRILDRERTEVRYNSEWHEGLGTEGLLGLASHYTVARMLERDDFQKRYAEGRPISVMEFLYPLLQGYDSVAVEADIELGGNDQKFNLLVGRDLQRDWGQEPQVAMTVPLLEGLDGVQKMSQSLGNYVGIAEPADEMFGKLMSIPDGLIAKYLLLCTDLDPKEVELAGTELERGLLRPDIAKRRMAREVVDLYRGAGAGIAAEERFDLVHKRREIPEDVPVVDIPAELASSTTLWLPRLLTALGLAGSNTKGRTLIAQRGVRLDGEPLEDEDVRVDDLRGRVLQVGTHRFVRLR